MRAFRSVILAGLFVAAALLTATSAFAQGFGVEAGITRASLHADNPSDLVKGRTGVMGGIWFGGNRNGRVGFMGEITYVVKAFSNEGVTPNNDLKLHYIELPEVFRINIGQMSKNGFIVYPLFGTVIDIKLKTAINGIKNPTDNFNGYDFGLMGGLGVEWARIGVEARGNWGLRSLETTDNFFGGLVKAKSRTIQILAKLRIN
jgi:hypothetical protein